MLEALLKLDAEGPLELAPTFLGAHAIPPEYKDDPQGYTDHLCKEMLPAVKAWWDSQESDLQPRPCHSWTFSARPAPSTWPNPARS